MVGPCAAMTPLGLPVVPEVKNKAWVHNPIDAFVLAKLEATGLQPNPATNPESLLRRIHYDLVGLPPVADKAMAPPRTSIWPV